MRNLNKAKPEAQQVVSYNNYKTYIQNEKITILTSSNI